MCLVAAQIAITVTVYCGALHTAASIAFHLAVCLLSIVCAYDCLTNIFCSTCNVAKSKTDPQLQSSTHHRGRTQHSGCLEICLAFVRNAQALCLHFEFFFVSCVLFHRTKKNRCKFQAKNLANISSSKDTRPFFSVIMAANTSSCDKIQFITQKP